MYKLDPTQPRPRPWLRALLFCCALLAANFAHAGLGESASLVRNSAATLLNGAVVERSYVDAGGTTIREYATSTGQVFAYTWRGPTAPDLRTLLGPRFAPFQTAAARPAPMHESRHASHVTQDDFVVEASGAMRAYEGRAWLPGALLAGVSITDLQ